MELSTDGENLQHIGVLRAFVDRILHNGPLVAEGVEGINGLMLSNAMHLSSWLERPVSLPVDEDLFLEQLNRRKQSSKQKKQVQEVTFDTKGSYGTKSNNE